MGGDRVHRGQDRLHGPDALQLGATGRARDKGKRPGTTTDDRERIKQLDREVRELRQANEILRKASAYFAQAELDRRWKP
jgi:transposase